MLVMEFGLFPVWFPHLFGQEHVGFNGVAVVISCNSKLENIAGCLEAPPRPPPYVLCGGGNASQIHTNVFFILYFVSSLTLQADKPTVSECC